MTKAAKEVINKIFKRAKTSRPPVKPRGYLIDKDQAVTTQQRATSIRQIALLPMGPDIRNPLKDLLCALESPLHVLQELNPMFSAPSMLPPLLKIHPTPIVSASCTPLISKLPKNISYPGKGGVLLRTIHTWKLQRRLTSAFGLGLLVQCNLSTASVETAISLRPDPEPKVHRNLQLNPHAVLVLQCTAVSPHIMLRVTENTQITPVKQNSGLQKTTVFISEKYREKKIKLGNNLGN